MGVKEIEKLIIEGEYQKAWQEIGVYEENFPNNSELDTYKFLCMTNLGKEEEALSYAQSAVKKQPYVADVHFNCGYAYQRCEKYFEAYEQYAIAQELVEGNNPFSFQMDELYSAMKEVLGIILQRAEEKKGELQATERRWLDYIVFQNKIQWGVRTQIFHQTELPIIGNEYMDYPELKKLYIGVAGLCSVFRKASDRLEKNTISEEAEMQRVGDELSSFEINEEQDCYLPIVMENRGNLIFQSKGREIDVSYNSPLQYVNYRVPKGKTVVKTMSNKFRVGELVPIEHNNHRRHLILSIFVDGLSQTVLDDNMEVVMPYTYRFFKQGMICTNVHTTGDWTLPSVVSYVTGQTIAKHKLLHPDLLRKIDRDTPILFEYFKKHGYNTSKIGGNWRIAPNYGYARGMNRVLYQHMYEGLSIEKTISEVEEQIYSMRDTDQYIWMELGDLHLIADELNCGKLQSEFDVWDIAASAGKTNSVKQNYDETKKKYYMKQIEYIDRKLAGLFSFISDYYRDEDFIISLFSDHGQGYLVKPNENFLSDSRTKVAFMVRGNGITGITDELISACDYGPVLCKVAGIEFDLKNTDASLPVAFGGKMKREFTVTESIHPGDPYQVVLNGDDFRFYLRSEDRVTSECRVRLDKFTARLTDKDGNDINDCGKKDFYTKWCIEHIEECGIIR